MPRRLPPLTGLRAFEAAARHLSFKQAAEELNVTPAAVSQQIRALEDQLGLKLFRRLTRGLALTEPGRAALPGLTAGFDQLAEAVTQLRAREADRSITISVSPSFGALWLVPRLDTFHAAHPELDVRLDATDKLADFTLEEVDIAVRYGRGQYEGLEAECLLAEATYPVCSPALLAGPAPIDQPSDLRHHTLLHAHWRTEHEAMPNWRMWLRAAGVEDIDTTRGPRFSNDSFALDAAMRGQGVALGSSTLAVDALRAGRLVRLFADTATSLTAFAYWLVYPRGALERPKVLAFRDWILSQADETARERDQASGQGCG